MKDKAKDLLSSIKGKVEENLQNAVPSDLVNNIKEKASQAIAEGTEKASQVIADGTEKASQVISEGAEKASQVIAEGAENVKKLQENFEIDIFMILDKLLAHPENFQKKIIEKINDIKDGFTEPFESEEDEKQAIAEQLIASYIELAATSGDLLNMSHIIPGAFFASMPAGLTLFVKFPSELVMSLAVNYGYDITQDDIKDLCFILYISGALQEEKAIITPENMETYLKMVRNHFEHIDKKAAIKNSFATFGKILARKGIVNLTGASSEFSINKGFAIFLGKQVNNYFLNYHEEFSQIEPTIVIEEEVEDTDTK